MNSALHLASQGKPLSEDPYISGRIYELASQTYKAKESEYSKSMSKLFLDVKTADGRRIDELKSNLLDWFLAEKAVMENRVKLLDNTIRYIKAIDREKDVNTFIREGEFLCGDRGTTIFDVLPRGIGCEEVRNLIEKDIMKSGSLYRQGRLIASNWKEMYAVITQSGFFHSFESPQTLKPTISIYLADIDVHLKPELGEFVFEIAIPNSSFFSLTGAPTRVCYKAESEETMVEWICFISKHIKR